MKPLQLKIDFFFTTPGFLGNGSQMAELRPQSFRGLLRFWHRAIDGRIIAPDEPDKPGCRGSGLEDRIWGGSSTGYGQSKVLLRISSRKKPQFWRWNRDQFSRFSDGRGKDMINGALYLGYPFGMRGNESRNALAAGTLFTLHGVIPRTEKMADEEVQGVLAAFWLLAMLGSCGSRSRRGFGSLQARGWILENSETLPLWQHLFEKLPRPDLANSPSDWMETMNKGLEVLKGWFPAFPDLCIHPHLDMGKSFQPVLLQPGSDWQQALARGGERMQRFRRKMKPDYERMRSFLDHPEHGNKPPLRTTFGLPLTFRFSTGDNRGPATLYPRRIHDQGAVPNRFASPLFIKIIQLGVRWYPLFFLLEGMQPGRDIAVWAETRHKQYDMTQDDESALDDFFAEISKESVA